MRLLSISRSCFALTVTNRFQRQSFQFPTTRLMMASDYSSIIDVDCNLFHRDLKSLKNKEESEGNPWKILEEDAIKTARIKAMLSPASTLEEAAKGLEIINKNPPPLPVKTTVGIHPYHVNDDELKGKGFEECEQIIKTMLASQPELCAAVGECGLDASEGFPPLEDQIPWFKLQVKIAEDLKLPLFVHERLAFEETMEILTDVGVPVIIHCFTGTKSECKEYVERGYHISVSGYILKESNDNYAEVIACLNEGIIPLDKLMIETDAPYMGFVGSRQLYLEHNKEYVESLNSKKRKRLQQSMYPNVPSSLVSVLDKVVACLQDSDSSITREAVAAQTTLNAKKFFKF